MRESCHDGGLHTLSARMYVDPTCGYTWQALPQAAALQQEYANRITFEYVVTPLRPVAEDSAQAEPPYRCRDMAPHLAEVALTMGRPASQHHWETDPIATSWAAAAAWLAAQRQESAVANRYFEAQAEAVMRWGRNISLTTVLLDLAEACGLNSDQLQAELSAPDLMADLEASVAAAGEAGILACPTLVLTGPAGQEFWVVGPQPYAQVRAAAEAALAAPAPGPPVKFGGLQSQFDDLAGEGRLPVPGGWRLELRVSSGRPDEQKVPLYLGVRVFQVSGGWTGAAGEVLFREMWQAGLPLVMARGRDSSGAEVRLIGVRAGGESPVKAGSGAGQRAAMLRKLGAQAGLVLQDPRADALRWLDALLAAGDRPLVNLKWIPGSARTDPCPSALSPCGVVVLAVPLSALAIQEEERRLRSLEREWLQLPAGPDREDGLVALRRESGRVAAAKRVGAWESWAAGFYPAGGEMAGYQAAEQAWTEHSLPYPLRPVLVRGRTAEHLRRHAGAFTLCTEVELHGVPRWNSQLVSDELVRFLQASPT